MSISATYAIQTQKPNPPTISLNLQLAMNSILKLFSFAAVNKKRTANINKSRWKERVSTCERMNLTPQELWMNEEVQVHYTYKSCERKRAVSGVQGTQPLMWAKSTTNEFAFLSISTTNLINLTTAILIIWIFNLCIFDIFDSFTFWLYPTLEGINWKAKACKVGMVKEKLLLFQGSASALGQPSKAGIPHKLQVQKLAGLACNPAALSTRWWGEACNHILDP